MPQSRLECSRAVADVLDAPRFFTALHKALVEIVGAGLSACKSRVCVVEQVYIADGAAPRELAALEIALLAGRTVEQKARAGEAVLALLREALAPVSATSEVHASVRLVDMDHGDYFKAIDGPDAA